MQPELEQIKLYLNQRRGLVELTRPKIDLPMLDSTYLSPKTREEQQQTLRPLLFYYCRELNENEVNYFSINMCVHQTYCNGISQ